MTTVSGTRTLSIRLSRKQLRMLLDGDGDNVVEIEAGFVNGPGGGVHRQYVRVGTDARDSCCSCKRCTNGK